MKYSFDATLIGLMQGEVDMIALRPLLLGGAQGPAGGVGGPPGGYIGRLPQWRVAYDQSEQATTWTVGSGTAPVGLVWPSGCLPSGCVPTLWDNLNHIRARISTLETASGISASGISAIDVERNGVYTGSGDTLNFIEGSNVTIAVADMGNTVDIQIGCTCSGVTGSGGGVTDHGLLAGLGDDDHPQYIKDTEYGVKGDVLAGTGAGTFAAEAIGTDYYFLQAFASGNANGIRWHTAPQWANVVVVAKTGGDYTSVTDAMAAIVDAASDNRYVIMVAPDMGDEAVTLKSYVDLCGFGTFNTGSGTEATHLYGLQVLGAPTDVSISNMFLGGDIEGVSPTYAVKLTGGNVSFHHCRVYGWPLGASKSTVYTTGGTHRFYGCEVVNNASVIGGWSGDGSAIANAGATLYFYNCKLSSIGTYASNGIFQNSGSIYLHQGTEVVGSVTKSGGSIYCYIATVPSLDISALSGAGRKVMIGELYVLSSVLTGSVFTDTIASYQAGLPVTIDDNVHIVDALSVDTINEHTGAAGVTIETVLVKDGLVDGVDVSVHAAGGAHSKHGVNPACKLHSSANQGITYNTTTLLTFDTIEYDSLGTMADLANERIYCRETGTYDVGLQIRWHGRTIVPTTVNPTLMRNCQIVLNAGNAVASNNVTAVAGTRTTDQQCGTKLALVSGDYIEGYVLHLENIDGAGTELNVDHAADFSVYMSMTRVA